MNQLEYELLKRAVRENLEIATRPTPMEIYEERMRRNGQAN